MGVRRLAVVNGPNILQMLLVFNDFSATKSTHNRYVTILISVLQLQLPIDSPFCCCMRYLRTRRVDQFQQVVYGR